VLARILRNRKAGLYLGKRGPRPSGARAVRARAVIEAVLYAPGNTAEWMVRCSAGRRGIRAAARAAAAVADFAW